MGAVFRRELKAFFISPIAYIYIAVFFFYTGFYFVNFNIMNGTSDMSVVFGSVFTILMVTLPLLTMRLLAEERRQKTDQLLLTSPVSLFSIVAGKFFAATVVFVCGLTVYGFFLIAIKILGGVITWSLVIGNLTALLFLGMSFIAIGVFISSMTENQVVSAILCFITNMVFYLIDSVAGLVSVRWLRTALYSIGFYSRYSEFSTGIMNIGSILFFLSVIFIFIFLTVRVLEKRRWS